MNLIIWKLSQVDGTCDSLALWSEFSHGLPEVLGSNQRSNHILFPHLWHLVAQCGSVFGSEQIKDCPQPLLMWTHKFAKYSSWDAVNLRKCINRIRDYNLQMRDITWVMLRPVTQQTPGRYLCCKSICTNIIFSWWKKKNWDSVLSFSRQTTLSTLFGKYFLLRQIDMYSHWSLGIWQNTLTQGYDLRQLSLRFSRVAWYIIKNKVLFSS